MKIDFITNRYNVVSTASFVLAILVAHLFSTNGYDWTKNTISDLASQGYERKLIMQIGFLSFGLIITIGILVNGLTWRTAPIFIYGLCVGLSGIFCTKPFFQLDNYSPLQATIHSVMAQTAGVAFSIGILMQLFYSPDKKEKWIHLIFFIMVICSSALFSINRPYQGIFQRLLYLISFIWLVKFYRP